MKFRPWSSVVAVTLFMTLAMLAGVTAQNATAQETTAKHHHYKLFDAGTFGGPTGEFANPSSRTINDQGTATGIADTSIPDPFSPNCFGFDCLIIHGFVWKNGVTTDLGTLPGGASSFAIGINDTGLIAVQSQNGAIDPLTGFPEARGVLWRNGQIIDLGTLGGNQSNANAINDLGQVVGGALTAIPDPFANAPQSACIVLPSTGFCSGSTFASNSLFSPGTTETHAFLWHNGLMRDLGTLGGPDSNAWATNDLGEVAGWSYTSFVANPSTGTPTVDPFLWTPEDGKMTDLGSLGGTFGAPFWLNNRGQVVGVSNLAGDVATHPFLWSKSEGMKDLGTFGGTFSHPNWINDSGEVVGTANTAGDQSGHAFLWRQGVMTDLGTIGTDPDSDSGSINSQGQVVGGSGIFGVADLHGFLWEHEGPIVDLEKLVVPGSGLTVVFASVINDRGEITAEGMLPNGDQHPVLLIPCDENHPNIEGCDYSLVDSAALQSSAAPIPTANATAAQANLTPSQMKDRLRALQTGRNRRFGVPPPK